MTTFQGLTRLSLPRSCLAWIGSFPPGPLAPAPHQAGGVILVIPISFSFLFLNIFIPLDHSAGATLASGFFLEHMAGTYHPRAFVSSATPDCLGLSPPP